MNPLVYAIPVFMLTILIEVLVAWRRRRPLYSVPDSVTSLHLGMLSQISGAFAKTLSLGIYIAVFQHLRVTELPSTNPASWIFALLAYDLAYYWGHRCYHEIAFMWAGHVVHHSSEYFNLSTALRQAATTSLYGWPFYLPLAICGVSPMMFAVVGLIDLLYQYWVHTELIGRLGILDRILVTPSNHRVHHGQNDYCIDRNYGGIFILWDRIFGTFADEQADEPVVFGIRKPLRSLNPLWGNLHFYVELWERSWAQRGLLAKLAVWFQPPGGKLSPGEPLPHFEPARFTRYDPAPTPAVQGYALLQYAVMALTVTHFIAIASSLSLEARALYGLLVVVSTVTVGTLLEGVQAGRWIEQLRVMALALAFAIVPSWFGYMAPPALRLAALVFALLSVGWLQRAAKPATVHRAAA